MPKKVDVPMAVIGAGIGLIGCVLLADALGLLGLLGAFLMMWGNNLSTASVRGSSSADGVSVVDHETFPHQPPMRGKNE